MFKAWGGYDACGFVGVGMAGALAAAFLLSISVGGSVFMVSSDSVVYLDNASTSWPKPPEVAARMSAFLASEAANPGRAGHRMAMAAERMVEGVRRQLTDFIGGVDPQRMILAFNCTDALNIAIHGLLRSGDHVITTAMEHNSVSRPLQTLAEAGVITLTRVGFSPAAGVVDPDEIRRAIRPNTRLIALAHAGNVLGTIQPVAEVGRVARGHGVLLLVDGAQSVGAAPVHVGAMGIDVLAFPGHKGLLGPTGTGAVYFGAAVQLESLVPFRHGGSGSDSASPTQPREWPHFLEAGTPNIVGVAGLGAALEVVRGRGVEAIAAHERKLVERLLRGLGEMPEVRVFGPVGAGGRVGVVSFTMAGYTPQETAAILDESFGIAVRAGLHCAPYAHGILGTFPEGAVRASVGPDNSIEHVDALLAALRELGQPTKRHVDTSKYAGRSCP